MILQERRLLFDPKNFSCTTWIKVPAIFRNSFMAFAVNPEFKAIPFHDEMLTYRAKSTQE